MAKTQQGNPDEGESNDIGTAFVREAGCGIVYVINLEDMDEEQFVVEMNREQTERLYAVVGKLLGKVICSPSNPTSFQVPPTMPVAPPTWATGSVTFPPNYPNRTMPGGLTWPSFNPWTFRW